MNDRDRINAVLTQMGMHMEDLSADCICARGVTEQELNTLIDRCGTTLGELAELLVQVRSLRDGARS